MDALRRSKGHRQRSQRPRGRAVSRRLLLLGDLALGLASDILNRALGLLHRALSLQAPVLGNAADLFLDASDGLILLTFRLSLLASHRSPPSSLRRGFPHTPRDKHSSRRSRREPASLAARSLLPCSASAPAAAC